MRGENATDVREWLLYYRWLGVEHVYLAENEPRKSWGGDSPSMFGQLADFVADGFLTLWREPAPQSQMRVYRSCIEAERAAGAARRSWIAFLDLDEFLVLRGGPDGANSTGHARLPDFLDRYKLFPGLSVHWIWVGPSGRRTRPHSGGVLRTYTQCAPKPRPLVKTIANTYFLVDVGPHPHNFQFRAHGVPVNEKRHPIPPMYIHRGVRCEPTKGLPSGCILAPGPGLLRGARATCDHIALFHFATRSEEDFRIKKERAGGVNKAGKPWSFFQTLQRDANETGGICEEPSRLASDCCPEADLVIPA